MNSLVLFTTVLLNIQLLSAASTGGVGIRMRKKRLWRNKEDDANVNQVKGYSSTQSRDGNGADESNTDTRYQHLHIKQSGERNHFGADEDV
ncbi:hypothetical protein DSO57_1030211 [Entomophthora muscae]|uniref:Uncharacterized protein n=1 Tax=Entomophthora muscae TaxID=34485 RepID=A0ACC2TMY4_9FUNG|nr:hypothetical protein DSO57_1030211 [Entomophthora muscae]